MQSQLLKTAEVDTRAVEHLIYKRIVLAKDGFHEEALSEFDAAEQYEEALESYDSAILIETNHKEGRIFRGAALQRSGHFQLAYQSYDKALTL